MSIARVAAKILIGQLAQVFDTPTAIVNHLTKSLLGYRRTDMFADANNAIEWDRYRSATKAVGYTRPKLRETIRSWDLPEDVRYSTHGISVWLDEPSGQIIKKRSSLHSDVLWQDDASITEDFAEMFADDQEKYKNMLFINFEVSGTEHNVDMTHLRLQETDDERLARLRRRTGRR